MYGTIARLRIKPDKLEALTQYGDEAEAQIPGFAFQYVFQSEADPNEVWLVVGFESREAYVQNAQSPEQAERYAGYRALLDAEPEWHDGTILPAR